MPRPPRWLVLTVLAAAALGSAACGDDDEPTNGGEASVDVGRYCDLTEELDKAGSEAFRELEQDEGATQQDFERAEANFVREHEDDLADLVDAAPPQIETEVEVLMTGLRVRAGLEDEGPSQRELSAAERTIKRFDRENCRK